MGRSSRITRTFHNRPRTTNTEKSKTNIPTPQTTKHVSGSVDRSEEPQRQTYNTPQAHAQEEQSISKTVYKAKNKAKAIKQQRNWHTPFTSFGQGMGNQAHDIGGSVHGLVTGQGYQVKSVLNRAVDHAFAGDWDSAGSVISDNPYRFAGNVVTEVGLAVIPFGLVARGAGIAGRVGGAATKVLSKTKSTKSGKYPGLEKKFKDKKYAGLKKKLSDSKVQGGIDQRHGQVHRQLPDSLQFTKKRSNTAARFPIEGRFNTTIKTAKIPQHNKSLSPDQTYFKKSQHTISVIPSELTPQGTFYAQPGRWNPNLGAVFRVADRQKIGGPKGTGSFKNLRGTMSSNNQHMVPFTKYPVPTSAVMQFNKFGKVKQPDGKTVKALVNYEGQFTPQNPFVPGV